MSTMNVPEYITVSVTIHATKADCQVCHTGMSVPTASIFGAEFVRGMLAAFVTAHTVHDRRGTTSGLTPSGRHSKAFREAQR